MAGNKILVIPCSGIGKVHGLLGREATYQALEKQSSRAETMCLAKLVTGDAAAVTAVKDAACVTIDGCAKMCACKNVEMAGGKVARQLRVADAFRNHRGARPGRAGGLTEEGWTIAAELADEIIDAIKSIEADEEVGDD